MTATSTSVDRDTVFDITQWLYVEAQLLDGRKFHEWLDLMAEDMHYVAPVRVTRERTSGDDVVWNMSHFDDSKTSLETRVLRLSGEYAWAEDPPSRTRHLVTNVTVAAAGDGEFDVRSNFMVYRTRGDMPMFDLLAGERQDRIRSTEAGYKLAKRVILLDQSTIQTHNLAVFL
ncbi:MAG: aromatic-ring-hydroxylating dioxygenase subunit beta [Rhodococcus sp. (in: high G+C Gram-positive bacteria)]|uniref:aromatic-ring-hydroxylating dioxygenase subunit beta n=1 Tax=Rhodococcus sp. TaxID=1831 RepID=UPI002AD7A97A|nr:aromatic-ring-hydroxylating dioxygenase subunit beta [Rhodococcus sp. (in: high G+C Gram-positive bacteria)]